MTQYYVLKNRQKDIISIQAHDGSGLTAIQTDLDNKVNADLVEAQDKYTGPDYSVAINTTNSNCKGIEVTMNKSRTENGIVISYGDKFLYSCYMISEHINPV